MLYNFEAPFTTGTTILKLLLDDDEDLINEDSQESWYKNHPKVRHLKMKMCPLMDQMDPMISD